MSARSGRHSWGGIIQLPDHAQFGERCLRVRASTAELESLLTYWSTAPASERPLLHGLTAIGREGEAKAIELLFEQAGDSPFVVLEVRPGAGFPRPSRVWPFSLWWEEELGAFAGVTFSGEIPERSATWRPI